MTSPLHSPRSMRLWICILLTLGLFSTVSMRLNLSMAVVCMVNSTAFSQDSRSNENSMLVSQSQREEMVREEERCPSLDSDGEAAAHSGYNGDLLWTPSMQSMLFSSTFYGAFITIAFSGYMADRFGPKMLLLAAAMDYVLVTLATPFLARYSYWAFFGARMVMGIGEGFMFPCLASIVGRWFAPEEKSTVAAMYTSGNQIAAGISSLVAASLCGSALGWPSIFYIFGGIGIVWCTAWYFIVTNSPFDNRFVSANEKEFLRSKVPPENNDKTKKIIPWRSILTSRPLVVAVLCQFSFNMQASIMQSFLPTYMKDQLRLPLSQNGLYTTVPFITQLIAKNVIGILADYLKRNGILSHSASARTFQTISSIGSGSLLIALALIPNCERQWTALPILGMYGLFFSCGVSGFFTSVMCLAPSLSGTLGSVSMVFGMMGNMGGPILLSVLQTVIPHHKWSLLFISCALINFASGTLFLLFGSAEVQTWARSQSSNRVDDLKEERKEKIREEETV